MDAMHDQRDDGGRQRDDEDRVEPGEALRPEPGAAGAPAEPPFPAWVSGRLVPAGEPAIPADDEGLLHGLSIYDTLLHEHGEVLFLESHLARFSGGLAELAIELPWDPREAIAVYLAALAAEGRDLDARLLLRLTATRGTAAGGSNLVVTARRAEVVPTGGVVLALTSTHKVAADPTEGLKSTNRLRNVLAREAARAQGAWEVLFQTTDGFLSEGSISNLFLVLDGAEGPELLTPPLADGCLAGTTRDLVLRELAAVPLVLDGCPVPCRVAKLTSRDLAAAREAFLTNSSQRVVPVRRVLDPGGAPLGADRTAPGPVSRAVRERIETAEGRYRGA